MASTLEHYQQTLVSLKEAGQDRRCPVIGHQDSWPEIVVDGKPAIDFCSNNYLGLAHDPRLKAAAIAAVEQYGVGSGASRLISGTSEAIEGLEKAVADFKGCEKALIFNSGYQANVGVLQALLTSGDWVFLDQLSHASLLDGALLSGSRWRRYRHRDLKDLDNKLQKVAKQQGLKWIVTESVFSMDGDRTDVKALAELAQRYNANILIDEAHATGLYGQERRSGWVEELNATQEVTLQMGTFSKALGGFGAYVAGSESLVQIFVNRCRSFIYSTALPPAVIGAAHEAVKLVQSDGALTQKLWDNVAYFQPKLVEVLKSKGLKCPSKTQIFPIILGKRAMKAAYDLLEAGYFVQGIRPPSVQPGTQRLRITLSAAHTIDHMDGFLEALNKTL